MPKKNRTSEPVVSIAAMTGEEAVTTATVTTSTPSTSTPAPVITAPPVPVALTTPTANRDFPPACPTSETDGQEGAAAPSNVSALEVTLPRDAADDVDVALWAGHLSVRELFKCCRKYKLDLDAPPHAIRLQIAVFATAELFGPDYPFDAEVFLTMPADRNLQREFQMGGEAWSPRRWAAPSRHRGAAAAPTLTATTATTTTTAQPPTHTTPCEQPSRFAPPHQYLEYGAGHLPPLPTTRVYPDWFQSAMQVRRPGPQFPDSAPPGFAFSSPVHHAYTTPPPEEIPPRTTVPTTGVRFGPGVPVFPPVSEGASHPTGPTQGTCAGASRETTTAAQADDATFPSSRQTFGGAGAPTAPAGGTYALPPNWWQSGRPSVVAYSSRDPRRTIREWRLTFSGGNETSAEDFLCRVEEMRRGTNLSDDDLLSALPDLLDGIARLWARQECHMWRSWLDFVFAFRMRYSDRDLQFRVRQELMTRTQGEREPINDYVVVFRHVVKFLRPQPPLEEQLTLLYNNLRPEYRRSFLRTQLTSYSDLEQLGREFEVTKKACQLYRPPPEVSDSWFPEVAYKPAKYHEKALRNQPPNPNAKPKPDNRGIPPAKAAAAVTPEAPAKPNAASTAPKKKPQKQAVAPPTSVAAKSKQVPPPIASPRPAPAAPVNRQGPAGRRAPFV